THLLFIDSDIKFSEEDVLLLLHWIESSDDKDVMCGPYPKKTISWEKVKDAVDKGLADDDPKVLEKYSGDFVLNRISSESFNLYEPIEVNETGTGFMMIKRKVFE